MIRFTINNSTTKLTGDYTALNKLYKHLRFKHPNAYFIMKKVKYGWDGYVNPLSDKGVLKTGLLPEALEFLSQETEEYEIVDHRKIPEVMGVPYKVGPLEMTGKFAFQRACIEALVYNEFLGYPHPRGIAAAAVNAGKTTIMMGIHMTYKDAKTMILLNNKVLYKQLKADLALVFPHDYGYMQGKSIQWGSIMVVMVQTLANRLDQYAQQLKEFNILLTDECDLADNATFETVYKHLSHIAVRFGFTGTIFLRTLKKDRLRNLKMKEIFGESLFTIDPITLEELDVSTKTTIKIVKGNERTNYEPEDFTDEWATLVTFNGERNQKICRRIWFNRKLRRKYVMVFCKFIDQVEETYTWVKEAFPNVPSDYTHHKREGQDQIIKDFKEGRLQILVTSLYLKRGMNLPWTQVIINAAGGEWYSNPLQITGRGVRKHESKDEFILEDFYDEGHYIGSHSKMRVKYYKKVGYDPIFVD